MIEENYFSYPSKKMATREASLALSKELTQLSIKKIPILLLLSGGSALKLLDNVDISWIGHNVTIGVLDERFSTDESVNNYSQLTKTKFYQQSREAGCSFIETYVLSNETQEMLCERFEKALKEWKQTNPTGIIFITQGEGPDGHTSGVLPFPENPELFKELFLNPKKWVVAYDANSKSSYPLRVTTTLSFLKEVNISFLFVCGSDKKGALSSALDAEGTLAETPARIIQEMPDVRIFTDIS